MKLTYKIEMRPELEGRLLAETARRGLSSVEEVLPVILEEYFRMWDDLESGAALLKPNEAE